MAAGDGSRDSRGHTPQLRVDSSHPPRDVHLPAGPGPQPQVGTGPSHPRRHFRVRPRPVGGEALSCHFFPSQRNLSRTPGRPPCVSQRPAARARPSPGCTSRPERKPGPATHGDEPNTVSDLVCRLSGQAAHGLFHNRSRGRESPPARGTDSRPQPRKPPREQVSPRGLLQMTPQPPLPARGLAGDPDAQAPRELRPDPRPTESLG